MERDNLLIVCVSLIVIVLIVCGSLVYLNSVKDTKLYLKDNSIYKDEKLTFILIDDEKNPLANKTLTVIVTNSKNKSKSFNLTTNEKGVAKLSMKYEGKFKINATFEGEIFLKSSTIVKKVKVEEKVVETQSSSASGDTINDAYSLQRASSADLVSEGWGYQGNGVYSKKYGNSYVLVANYGNGYQVIGEGDRPNSHGYHY